MVLFTKNAWRAKNEEKMKNYLIRQKNKNSADISKTYKNQIKHRENPMLTRLNNYGKRYQNAMRELWEKNENIMKELWELKR